MFWTHIYDLILKLLTFFLSLIILIYIPFLEDKGIVVVMLNIIIFFILYNLFIRTLATYLYSKYTLKMNLNFSQAKQLNDAFTPVFPINMKWLPMTELKNINDTNKFQIALNTYKKWHEQNEQNRKQQIEGFKNLKKRTKILTIIMYALIVYFMIAVFLDLPPANFISLIYCKLFDTEKFYPFLDFLILALTTVLLFKFIDKDIKL